MFTVDPEAAPVSARIRDTRSAFAAAASAILDTPVLLRGTDRNGAELREIVLDATDSAPAGRAGFGVRARSRGGRVVPDATDMPPSGTAMSTSSGRL